MGSTSDNEDEEHQEQMEAHGYAECIGCGKELHKDELGVYRSGGYICIDCKNEWEQEGEINKLQEGEEEWNNRTCIGRKSDDCGSPCNSSSAEFCDDCLAQEIGYCY